MAQFHFVEDYEKLVDDLLAKYPIDRAMELAVGDNYEAMGQIQFKLLQHAGLESGMSVFDLGCGSGRLANALAQSGMHIDYIGTDIVQKLLDYAESRAPSNYRFIRNQEISIPAPDQSIDIACAFSVFTHLLHHESYLYLEEMRRVLKPRGTIVFSFLEMAEPYHWKMFERTVEDQRGNTSPHLNMFIERNVINTWASKPGFRVEAYIDALHALPWSAPLGQTSVILINEPEEINEPAESTTVNLQQPSQISRLSRTRQWLRGLRG